MAAAAGLDQSWPTAAQYDALWQESPSMYWGRSPLAEVTGAPRGPPDADRAWNKA